MQFRFTGYIPLFRPFPAIAENHWPSIALQKPMFKMFTQKYKVTATQQKWPIRVQIHNQGNIHANINQEEKKFCK